MKKNLGTTDKVIRLLTAIVGFALYATNVITGTLAVILLVVSALLILTSFVNFCPIYWLLGIGTTGLKGIKAEK